MSVTIVLRSAHPSRAAQLLELGQQQFDDPACGELFSCVGAHFSAVERLGLVDRVKVRRESGLVFIAVDALAARRKTIHSQAGCVGLDQRGAGSHTNCRAASQHYLLQRQRAVVIVLSARS